MLSPAKIKSVQDQMQALGIHELDLREDFIRGSGRGGQKINKTNSCVQLTHLPSMTVIKCQASRSREDNRWLARRLLCERLEEIKLGAQSKKQQQIHKLRAQKKKRSKRAKEKLVGQKRHRGEIKAGRRVARVPERE